MNTDRENYLPTRESLLNRLRDWDDHKSWKAFDDTYRSLIFSVARRAGLNEAEAEDVVQETIITVARKLPDFKYDRTVGSFKGWLLTLTRWRIQDQFRKKHYHRNGQRLPREEALRTSLLERQPAEEDVDLGQVWDEEWRRNIIEKAIQRVKPLISPRQYQMFHLHVQKAIPARQVAERLKTTLATVYFAKYKVSSLLKKEIRDLDRSLR